MTIESLLKAMVQTFDAAGLEQAHFEARQLVQEGLGLTFAQVMGQPDRILSPAEEAKLTEWQRRRLAGEPLAYLSGRRGFYKYDFYVEPGVLVPRPETELVVETVLRRVDDRPAPAATLADLGCGSGCIGLSLISELTGLRLWAIDMSAKACEVTLRNAAALDVTGRLQVENKKVVDWVPGLDFDIIVANPPYVAINDPALDAGVRAHEPAEALFGGEDGLEYLRAWTEWAMRHLRPLGLFVCEFGAGQSRSVQDMVAKQGFGQIQIERDLAGHDRVISAVKAR
jgi:release factor glutamine methyltransferase